MQVIAGGLLTCGPKSNLSGAVGPEQGNPNNIISASRPCLDLYLELFINIEAETTSQETEGIAAPRTCTAYTMHITNLRDTRSLRATSHTGHRMHDKVTAHLTTQDKRAHRHRRALARGRGNPHAHIASPLQQRVENPNLVSGSLTHTVRARMCVHRAIAALQIALPPCRRHVRMQMVLCRNGCCVAHRTKCVWTGGNSTPPDRMRMEYSHDDKPQKTDKL